MGSASMAGRMSTTCDWNNDMRETSRPAVLNNPLSKQARPNLAKLYPVIVAGVSGLLLSGCSATHVGESWQCPPAQGGDCASVADADPAVPDTPGAVTLAIREPLYRPRPGGNTRGDINGGSINGGMASDDGGHASNGLCGTSCNPIAWLARLFAHKGGAGDGANDGVGDDGNSDSDVSPARDDVPLQENNAPPAGGNTSRTKTAGANNASVPDAASAGQRSAAGLRTGEVVGRIWIAPFVDADGVYHEAGWVRVVLEPSAWQLQ